MVYFLLLNTYTNKRTIDELDSTGTYIFFFFNIANKRTADVLDGMFFLLLNKANKRTADELDGIIVKYSQQENS